MKRGKVEARQLELLPRVEVQGRMISEEARGQVRQLLARLIRDLWEAMAEPPGSHKEQRDE